MLFPLRPASSWTATRVQPRRSHSAAMLARRLPELGLRDRETFSSGHGNILELIKSNTEFPSGVLIFEDPPLHTFHRSFLARLFTPKRMVPLESKIREFCGQCLDPLIGGEGFEFG